MFPFKEQKQTGLVIIQCTPITHLSFLLPGLTPCLLCSVVLLKWVWGGCWDQTKVCTAEAAAVSGMTSATQEVFCYVGIFIRFSADIVSVD